MIIRIDGKPPGNSHYVVGCGFPGCLTLPDIAPANIALHKHIPVPLQDTSALNDTQNNHDDRDNQ
jgi:hypothetical protein